MFYMCDTHVFPPSTVRNCIWSFRCIWQKSSLEHLINYHGQHCSIHIFSQGVSSITYFQRTLLCMFFKIALFICCMRCIIWHLRCHQQTLTKQSLAERNPRFAGRSSESNGGDGASWLSTASVTRVTCSPFTGERALKSHKGHPATTNSCLSARFALICLHCHQPLSEEVPFVRDAGTCAGCSWSQVDQKSEKLRWLLRASQ